MNHLLCLISTLKCSSKVLKMIEFVKWLVIFSTFAIAGICACKMIKSCKSRKIIKFN